MIHLKKIRFLPVLLVIVLLLSGCIIIGDGEKQTWGTLLGAGVGALAGSQLGGGKGKLVAVAIGTLGGAFLGNRIGKSMDDVDKLKASKAQQSALENNPRNVPTRWRNPNTGHSGTVIPTTSTYKVASGQYCREYQHDIMIGGQTERTYGTACRMPDGSWRVIR